MYIPSELEFPMNMTPNNSSALAAFVSRKAEIDVILPRLAALSAEHFNCTPDEVIWADVGTLESYLQRLRTVSDAAFCEGDTRPDIKAPAAPPEPRPGRGRRNQTICFGRLTAKQAIIPRASMAAPDPTRRLSRWLGDLEAGVGDLAACLERIEPAQGGHDALARLASDPMAFDQLEIVEATRSLGAEIHASLCLPAR